MIKNLIRVSLVIVGSVGLSITCIAMQNEEDTEESNHEKANAIIRTPSKTLKDTFDDFCFREDFYEMERQKRYESVWKEAKRRKKRMRYLETELKKEAEKPGEIAGEVTFRYQSLSAELERLEEEKEEIDKHFGGVNPPISDDEVEDENVKREEKNPLTYSEIEEGIRLLKSIKLGQVDEENPPILQEANVTNIQHIRHQYQATCQTLQTPLYPLPHPTTAKQSHQIFLSGEGFYERTIEPYIGETGGRISREEEDKREERRNKGLAAEED